jgi:hypothetical protein
MLSSFAFDFNLRRYIKVVPTAEQVEEVAKVEKVDQVENFEMVGTWER